MTENIAAVAGRQTVKQSVKGKDHKEAGYSVDDGQGAPLLDCGDK